MYVEDDFVMISSLQHILFCERQYALIHLEQLWAENRFTAEGELLHERVHSEHHESRKTFRQEYDMAVRSLEHGFIGKCDLVELWLSGKDVARVSPVEFKRGRKKVSDVDRVQLCAQVLCLEEMFGLTIETGQLYYLQEKRRSDVAIDKALREKTLSLAVRARELRDSGITPLAVYNKRTCDNCSLVDICMPKSVGSGGKVVDRFIQNQIRLMREVCDKEAE